MQKIIAQTKNNQFAICRLFLFVQDIFSLLNLQSTWVRISAFQLGDILTEIAAPYIVFLSLTDR
tara:strand:- start:5324 stop:5515 length:192 start_codon:yes stop_codon:yes gene_type:complete